MAEKTFDFRDPIHGFISMNQWERDIVNHRVFQRLRRIRQLAWTDMVYPGAMHTRFEHTLGVMHTVTRMFDEVWARHSAELIALNFSKEAMMRHRTILRLAALLHDVGHSPFSHAGEDLMPKNLHGVHFKHETYSGSIVRHLLKDVIDDHPFNKNNFDVKADLIADVIENKATIGQALIFWRQLLDSQLDGDRADYLLRDSHHIGVQYGHYDLNRLVISLTVAVQETGAPVLALDEGGWHVAEALTIARYMMFSQVYFHKTRRAFDHHITKALGAILEKDQAVRNAPVTGLFPPPTTKESVEEYFAWDDWRVLGQLSSGDGGEHGEVLRTRDHYRAVFEVADLETSGYTSGSKELERVENEESRTKKVREELGSLLAFEDNSQAVWYKPKGELFIARGGEGDPRKELIPLSQRSKIVHALNHGRIWRFYVKPEDCKNAKEIVNSVTAQSRGQ